MQQKKDRADKAKQGKKREKNSYFKPIFPNHRDVFSKAFHRKTSESLSIYFKLFHVTINMFGYRDYTSTWRFHIQKDTN